MKLYIKFGEDISIGSKVISIVLLISYRRTDGQTDGQTDKVSHRGAPLLKTNDYHLSVHILIDDSSAKVIRG